VPEAFFHPHQTELFVRLFDLFFFYSFSPFCHTHKEVCLEVPMRRTFTEINVEFVFAKIQWAPKNFYGLCLKFQKQSYLSHFRALPDYLKKSELSGFRTFFIPNPLINLLIVFLTENLALYPIPYLTTTFQKVPDILIEDFNFLCLV
jgi:hypothetical protein